MPASAPPEAHAFWTAEPRTITQCPRKNGLKCEQMAEALMTYIGTGESPGRRTADDLGEWLEERRPASYSGGLVDPTDARAFWAAVGGQDAECELAAGRAGCERGRCALRRNSHGAGYRSKNPDAASVWCA